MYCIDLSGKRAVVVGGTSGIGRATAELLASAGAEVITLSRRAQPAPITTSDEVRARISHRVLDVADPAAVSRVFAEIATEGGVDISVHSAAVVIPAAATHTDDRLWRHHMTINVDGVFYTVREVLRHMITAGRGGKVVIIGSVSGLVGNPGFTAYCASKGLLINLTRQLAVEHAARGINVNSVLPGFTNTEMTDIYDSNTKAAIAAAIPAQAWATPNQIAHAVLFLSSRLADYVHGVNLPVDGGYLAAGPA